MTKKYYLIDIETGKLGEFKKKPKAIRWLEDGIDYHFCNGEVMINGKSMRTTGNRED